MSTPGSNVIGTSGTANNYRDDTPDLRRCPNTFLAEPGSELTIGDLHGNAIKLIYFLIRQGVMELPEKPPSSKQDIYQELTKLYLKAELTKQDINRFKSILQDSKFNTKLMVRLMGDELADRGKNDWFTLLILQTLKEKGVPFEILMSNHSIEFLRFHVTKDLSKCTIIQKNESRSFWNLIDLSHKKEIVSLLDLHAVTESSYIPNLKLLSYTLDEENNEITLYTHALVGLETIKALAAQFSLPYKDENVQALKQTIDKINEIFTRKVKDGTFIQEYDKELAIVKAMPTKRDDPRAFMENLTNAPFTTPLSRLLWSWESSGSLLKDPLTHNHNGYKIKHVHGHNGTGQVSVQHTGFVTNLDGYLGKLGIVPLRLVDETVKHLKDPYVILISPPSTKPSKQQEISSSSKTESKTDAAKPTDPSTIPTGIPTPTTTIATTAAAAAPDPTPEKATTAAAAPPAPTSSSPPAGVLFSQKPDEPVKPASTVADSSIQKTQNEKEKEEGKPGRKVPD